MAIEVTPTALGETIVTGDDYALVATITKDGATYNITGATITASLRPEGSRHNFLIDHAVTNSIPTSGIVLLALTSTETGGLLWTDAAPNYLRIYNYLVDFKVVESGGVVLHSEPLRIPVRRGITA